jgi:hypothetical protein
MKPGSFADRLDLLLASADERRPMLEEGIEGDAAERAPKPKKAARGDDAPHWRRTDADPNDLPTQRWAVIAPEGREGSRMLEAMAPLLRLREEEQGEKAMVYRVPAEMDARAAVAWKDEVYWSEDVEEEERPLYLLMLGDLHHVSLELQHSLANSALVGRAHFADGAGETNLDGFAAYAEKVVRFARKEALEAQAELCGFVARDGTSATMSGEARLVAPCLEAAEQSRAAGRLPVTRVRSIEAETADEFIAKSVGAQPKVLLSVSHGVGAPRRGWGSEEEAWRTQGALVLGQGEVLDAERARGQPFLPGGLWFFLACFGAGTPVSSAYHAWLTLLAEEGATRSKASAVLSSLPQAGKRPFVAALPQAVLANPEGPLAVIGHMDLAWTYGFSSAKNLGESRKSRIGSALEVLARGSRAGVGLEALMRFYREANDALMASYQVESDARVEGRKNPTDHKDRGQLWMLRNDLRGYVMLGDPAVRLPLRRGTGGVMPEQTSPVALAEGASVEGAKASVTEVAAPLEELGAFVSASIQKLQGKSPTEALAEAERVRLHMGMLEARARAEQEIAIAERIRTAAEVEIEDHFDVSGAAGSGPDLEGKSLGPTGSGKRVSLRIVRLKG